MKVLFISRAHPPVVGGIENQNYELSIHLHEFAETKTIANRHGKKFLPIFLPYALATALFLARKYDILLLGDGVMGIVGYFVKLFYGKKKKVICVVHGLDLTYNSGIYQKLWVRKFIPKLDKLIAVGNETIRQGIVRNIPQEKFTFIPNGVDVDKFIGNYSRSNLEKIIGENLNSKKVILTSGRLAKRKGVAWFVENVMPKLPENVIYVIAGDGADKENVKRAIEKNNLGGRVKLLGYVSDKVRNVLLNTCDIFIQPNIKVSGDMEGFGISVIEAASCKLPVIAANLEGLKDAIKDGENGFLVETEDTEGYLNKINELLADDNYRREFGERARRYAVENYSWKKIVRQYVKVMKGILSET